MAIFSLVLQGLKLNLLFEWIQVSTLVRRLPLLLKYIAQEFGTSDLALASVEKC